MKRLDEVAVFAAVIGFLVMALAFGALVLIKTLVWHECLTLGYQDSHTSISLPIKRLCIAQTPYRDEYIPLVVARAFAHR